VARAIGRLPVTVARWMRAVAAAALLLAAAIALAAPARGQVFPTLPFGTPAPATSTLTSAPVVLDGQTLFSVSVPANAKDQLSAAARAGNIADVLSQIVATQGSGAHARTAYDPASLRVDVDRHGGQNVLTVVDAEHRDPLAVATVTVADAQAQELSAEALTARWQETLQGALVHSLLIRQPGAQQRHLTQAAVIAIALAVLSFVGYGFMLALGRRIDALSLHSVRPTARLAFWRSVRGALLWFLVLAWFGAGSWAALQFPQTTPFGHTLLTNGLAIAWIVIATVFLDRVLSIVIGRLPAIWGLRSFANAEERTRQTLRVPTIVRAVSGFKTFVLIFVAILAAMTQLGIPVGSVVTIGGVAAIAVSLAAQNLIRDVVSGFLILAEDQFVVGDFVTINGSSGLVERLTLRMVQIRDGSGSVVTISNSAAASVINHSRNWSRVDYAISIDPAADVERAMTLIRSTAEQLQADPEWKDAIVDPIEWIGVEAVSRDGVIIRARIKTAPLRQFALQRELNRRIARSFADAKIAFGAPIPVQV
jgi:small-conductance mechanosensitive channel